MAALIIPVDNHIISPAADLENGKTVEVDDLRFGTPPAPAFLVDATVNARLQVENTSFRFGLTRRK